MGQNPVEGKGGWSLFALLFGHFSFMTLEVFGAFQEGYKGKEPTISHSTLIIESMVLFSLSNKSMASLARYLGYYSLPIGETGGM